MQRALVVLVLLLGTLVVTGAPPAAAADPIATTTTLTLDPPGSPHYVSQPLTLRAHVTSATGEIPTGQVNFSTGGCSHAGDFGTLDANGDTSVTPTLNLAAGSYSFTACYLGTGVTGDLFADSESSPSPLIAVVATPIPVLTTAATPGGALGTAVQDTATVTGGSHPTGTVTFSLYRDDACTQLVTTSVAPLSDGVAASAPYVPQATGTYRWVASYGGDEANSAVSGSCGDPGETVTIQPVALPATTRTVSGFVFGGVTVRKGESVLISGATVFGSVTVQTGGAVRIVGSTITNGITSSGAKALDLCGTHVSATSVGAISITGTRGSLRIGGPADGCAGNRIDGDVTLLSNRSLTMLGNTVNGKVTVTGGGPDNTVIGANTVGRLSCQAVQPAPIDLGQPNRGPKAGQCSGL